MGKELADIELVVAEEQEQPSRGLRVTGRRELQHQFIELRAKGWSYAKIAR